MIDFISTNIEIPTPQKQDKSFDGKCAVWAGASLLIPLVVMLTIMLIAMLKGDAALRTNASTDGLVDRTHSGEGLISRQAVKYGFESHSAIPPTSYGEIEYSNQRYPTVKNCGWRPNC